MRLFALLCMALIALTVSAQKPDKNERMKWWREARLGLFIHWGLYSVPAGKWGERTDHGEWIRDTAHIPVHEYEKFKDEFDPVKFDAQRWVAMAKAAGMKYIVITTKHHDGFNLFASKFTDWDITHTPFKRDIMKELSEACQKAGLKMCWYHSIMDWHHPDYLPRRPWEQADRPVDGANMDRYVQYLRNEVSQLLTDYGPIGVMWFDGEWEPTWNNRYGRPFYELCRKLQPNVIVNNRVSNDREGSMEASVPAARQVGDFTTPEQYIPATGLPGVDWETCMTMNDHWGYNAYDKSWKSSTDLIRNLVDIASKGGNYLLNVGPMANGEFPPEAVERLKAIGDFMNLNGDAIYDTQASVFDELPWGRSTTKADGPNTILYLHVFDWPTNGRLVLPPIGNQVVGANLLGSDAAITAEREGDDLVLHLPNAPVSPISSTVKLVVSGKPVVYKAPQFASSAPMLVDHMKVKITNRTPELDVRYTLDGSDPTAGSAKYSSPIDLSASATVKAAGFVGQKRATLITSASYEKVKPWEAIGIAEPSPGLSATEYEGDWDTMPNFDALTPTKSFVASKLDYPMNGAVPAERVGRRYVGFLRVPANDVYTFALSSDDGSRLWIDNHLVLDNDGLHSMAAKEGAAPLAKGVHQIRIEWFNKTGGAGLELQWAKAGSKLRPLRPGDVGH